MTGIISYFGALYSAYKRDKFKKKWPKYHK